MQNGTFNGHHVACDADSGYTTPNVAKVASAYGFETDVIYNNTELDLKLAAVLSDNKPELVVVKIDPEEGACPRTKSHKRADGSMESDFLEDMWPYIKMQ